MPSFNNTWINYREIYFAEFFKMLVIVSKHVHYLAAFVRNLFQWNYLYTVNHFFTYLFFIFRKLEYQSIVSDKPLSKSYAGFQPRASRDFLQLRYCFFIS